MKKVLLFSGGLDCYLISKLFGYDELLYIAHDNHYQRSEISAIASLYNVRVKGLEVYSEKEKMKILFDTSLNLQKFEKPNYIIDNRNLLFCTIAVNYGYDHIALGSVCGDRSKDQNEPFFTDLSKLLSDLNDREIKIYAPAKEYTKTELVAMYIERDFDIENLFLSYSCYTGVSVPCGQCKPCVRKYVALENNNIDTSKYFKTDPLKSDYFKDNNLKLIETQQWRGFKEDTEILNIYKKKISTLKFG